MPGSLYSRFGWVPSSSPQWSGSWSIACGGYSLLYPGVDDAGIERTNWLLYQVGGPDNPPVCNTNRDPYFVGEVRRDRLPHCPRGYTGVGSACGIWWIDIAKSLGSQCPTCGNPITPGSGNKFQKETDYIRAGEHPLRFERYYNSMMRTDDRHSTFYSFTEYYDYFGNESFHALASKQRRTGFGLSAGTQARRDAMHWANLGLDKIGANWRHSYLRSIYYIENDADGASTAFAFGHDGRVLGFVEYNGAFHAQSDVNDRLTGSPATGWQYTSAEAEEVETYNADGRLTSIRGPSGFLTETGRE